jgi:hypothetical protein
MGGIILALVVIATILMSVGPSAKPTFSPSHDRDLSILEQKIGECAARGGVARLDSRSGYLGCNFPILSQEQR